MISDSRIRLQSWAGRQLRRGPRSVLQAPATARVGNLLYFWLQAHIQEVAGGDLRVLENDHVGMWKPVWPEMSDRLGARVTTRFDRKLEVPVKHFQEFDKDFSRHQLAAFATSCLMTREFARWLTPPDPALLVLNVRRGDYYSNLEYRARYAMDIEDYVRRAVDIVTSSVAIRSVAIVTDDPQWCASHLTWLRHVGETRIVEGPPVAHLASLASASNLVLANSTFSYWGAYLAGATQGGAMVVAPHFHAAHVNDGRAWQLDPWWHIVDDPA